MRQIFLTISVLSIILINLQSCNNKESKSDNTSITDKSDVPANPEIKTDYGELPGGYKTMDEYYIDSKGNKVWHGRRVTQYPSGAKKMEGFYEHGVSKGYIKYDEVGNVTEDTRK